MRITRHLTHFRCWMLTGGVLVVSLLAGACAADRPAPKSGPDRSTAVPAGPDRSGSGTAERPRQAEAPEPDRGPEAPPNPGDRGEGLEAPTPDSGTEERPEPGDAPPATDTAPPAAEPDLSPDARGQLLGAASYYGQGFAGRPTASGEPYDPNALTAAHKTLPFGTVCRVTNRNNGRSVVVRVNDRGPYVRGRVIDLSREAARQLDGITDGVFPVTIEILELPD